MTCASCKYQWCWLCEGQYIYGHYDSGKCSGHQFTKADSLEEANQKKKVNNNANIYNINNNHNINNIQNRPTYCGLHNIFRCIFPAIHYPFQQYACYLDYFFIIAFWLFSVGIIFVFITMEFIVRNIQPLSNKLRIIILIFIIGMGISLFICFQAAFICLITPFMLVCLIYSPFFYKFIFFFGLGDY